MAKQQATETHPALKLLRGIYQQPGHLVELRAIPATKHQGLPIKRAWTSSGDEVVEFASKFDRNSGYGVYFGVCKRSREEGTKAAIVGAETLWADIDTVHQGWDTDKTLKALVAMPEAVRPSAVVKSGGGLHCYWFLDKPMVVKPVQYGEAQIEDANRIMQELVSGDAVQDVTRVMRLPGTWNTKRCKAAKVEVVYCYPWVRHDVHDIIDAACKSKHVLVNGEWIGRKTADKPTPGQTAEGAYTLAMAGGKAKYEANLMALWRDRVRLHAPRGYVGVDEAVMLTTARMHCAGIKPDVVVPFVLARVRSVKERDAPEEKWDWESERASIKAKLDRWMRKWVEMTPNKKARKKQ